MIFDSTLLKKPKRPSVSRKQAYLSETDYSFYADTHQSTSYAEIEDDVPSLDPSNTESESSSDSSIETPSPSFFGRFGRSPSSETLSDASPLSSDGEEYLYMKTPSSKNRRTKRKRISTDSLIQKSLRLLSLVQASTGQEGLCTGSEKKTTGHVTPKVVSLPTEKLAFCSPQQLETDHTSIVPDIAYHGTTDDLPVRELRLPPPDSVVADNADDLPIEEHTSSAPEASSPCQRRWVANPGHLRMLAIEQKMMASSKIMHPLKEREYVISNRKKVTRRQSRLVMEFVA